MTTPWSISAGAERVELDPAGKAEVTFTVTNSGLVDQRLVLDVVSSENAGPIRFTVAEPQRLVPHGGSVSYLVKIAVPPGTPAGARWVAGRVYSADTAPEETSVVSDRVAFEVKPTPAAVPWWRKWWWLIAAAALVLVVLAVVLIVTLGGDDEPPPTPPPAGPVVHKSGEVDIREGLFDLDELVPTASREEADAELFDAAIEAERFLQSNGAAQMALIPRGTLADDTRQACLDAELDQFSVNLGDIKVGDLVCARTNQGRLAVLDVRTIVSGGGSRIVARATTFE